MRKAVIENGIVKNIIEGSDEGIKGMRFPLGITVWDCGTYPVALGDRWENGRFYRDEDELAPVPTPEQEIAQLKDQLLQSDLALAELAELIAGGAK